MSLTQNYFNYREFMVDPEMRKPGSLIPLHVVEKLHMFHIPELNKIRHAIGRPVIVSQFSGYRTREWDISRGRSGSSQHTFSGHGAVDLTCEDFEGLVRELINSNYSRIIVYWHRSFVHCDYKDAALGRRYYEMSEQNTMREIENVR